MNTNEMNSKPRRAQGGKGLLSRSISVQNPQESMAKNPSPREERESTERERGATGGELLLCSCAGEKAKRERERVRGFLTPNNSQPKRLNCPWS